MRWKTEGKIMIVSAPIVFILSMLMLANQVIHPPESLPYKAGVVLCFLGSPSILISGIVAYVYARGVERKASAIAPAEERLLEARTIVKVELPPEARRIKRHIRILIRLGLLVAIASLVLGPFLGGLKDPAHAYMFPVLHEYQNTLGNGVPLGILLVIYSKIISAIASATKFEKREFVGKSMIISAPFILLFSFIVLGTADICVPGMFCHNFANSATYPELLLGKEPQSLSWQVGKLLCDVVAPAFLIFGVALYLASSARGLLKTS